MRFAFLLTIFFTLSFVTHAQEKTAAIKLGYFGPSATEGGFILGYQGNKEIDENFEYGWSVDWFNKKYVDKKLVREFEQFQGFPGGETNELRAKTNVHDFPVIFSLTAKYNVNRTFDVFVSGGFGLDVLLVYYRNYKNPNDDELEIAADFAYLFSVGAIYPLGSRSDLIAELSYHHSIPSWEYEIEEKSSPTQPAVKKVFERAFDMSGIMARVGFKFYY